MTKMVCTYCGVDFWRKGPPKMHNFCSRKHLNAWNSQRMSKYNSTENPMNKQEGWTAEHRNRRRKICLERGGHSAYKKVYGKHTHRVIAEMMLGRELLSNEVAHHKNFNRLDNCPENIEVITRSEHARLHAKEYWRKFRAGKDEDNKVTQSAQKAKKGGDANEIQQET